jgi:spore maturation protein CgeB
MNSLFGTADFYSKNLKKLGQEAIDIIANHEPIQKQWAAEHGMNIKEPSYFNHIPFINRVFKRRNWIFQILEAQIKQFQPDVVYNMAMETINSDFLKSIKTKYDIKLIIGQHAAPLTESMVDLSGYNLIHSSLPNKVEYFRSKGKQSEYFKLGFENTILSQLPNSPKVYDVTHIGGYGPIHNERNKILEYAAKEVNLYFWGYGRNNLREDSPILKNYRGPAWGLVMYNILRKSKITITGHITPVAGQYANNMRLYEATGMGALLITDYKKNLADIFEPDKEVVTYRNPAECVEKIKYYLENEKEREKIAKAGQRRTLKEYAYLNRMKELIGIVEKYI